MVVCGRLQDSRIGRAWMAIREDEIAAEAMGINVRDMKLLAFGRLDAGILRPLLIALAMIVTMMFRPRGLWPAP